VAVAARVDRSTVKFHETPSEREADAEACSRSIERMPGPKEQVEDVRQVLSGDAQTVALDAQYRVV